MTKDDVADALREIGTLLELKGEAGFRSKAYLSAARAVTALEDDLERLVKDKQLGTIPGVGGTTAQIIAELATTGRAKYLDDLRKQVPAGMIELLRVPGLGPKKAKALFEVLGVGTLDDLRVACESGRVAKVKGFGEKTAQRVLDAVTFLGTVENLTRYVDAHPHAEQVLDALRRVPGVKWAELVGSLRRRKEVVKNINIVVGCDDPDAVTDGFAAPGSSIGPVVTREPGRAVVVTTGNPWGRKVSLNADLRFAPDEQFPFALLYYTGNIAHNERLKEYAAGRGLALTETGLVGPNGPVPCRDEDEVYRALGLHWIPPEMREDTGEIERAAAGPLPTLIEYEDIRGVFHNHTHASDGTASLEDMALAAKALKFEFFGVGDHSQSLTVANGLSPDRVRAQWAEADALNRKLTGIRILKGTECDILPSGALDFPDDLLAGFDYVVASVHSHFGLSEEEQTARVCKALSHPAVTWLGHPTGRLLLRREGYKLDLEKVLHTAAQHGKMIEINAQPDRLDLDWRYVKLAKELGITLVINPDAHGPGELGLVRYGVNVARRGWLTAADVFNTRPLAEVLAELERRKKAWVK